jgi:endoglucanase
MGERMRGELSHGLPELTTSGNRILRADTMNPILLRGVNRSGLEYSEPTAAGFLAAAQFTGDELREIVLNWRANIVRLPFNQDWCLRGRSGHSAEEYLASVDQVISWTAALGAYTILDLQWLDAETVYGHTEDQYHVHRENHVPPTPNGDTILLWRTLAERYRNEPAVLFDLLNEPHDTLEDDLLPIHLLGPDGEIFDSYDSSVGPDEWVPWATRLTEEIRTIRPDGIILVGGVDWAFDLRQIRVNAPNIVYSAHIYSNRNVDDWGKALDTWNEAPVFVGEWGGKEQDRDFGHKLADLMRQRGLGWTAWSWVDDPPLVLHPRAPNYQPTSFGELVQNELRT